MSVRKYACERVTIDLVIESECSRKCAMNEYFPGFNALIDGGLLDSAYMQNSHIH